MCVVNSSKDKFEVIICDHSKNVIAAVNFASITLVCRFLEDFNFEYGDAQVYRKSDLQYFDPTLLMEIWKHEIHN